MTALIRQAVTWLEWWQEEARTRSPLPGPVTLPPVAPAPWGLDATSLMEDLDPVVRGSYNPWHPGAMAHLDPPPNPASVVGELVCAWLNNNMLAEELSPLLSRLERRLLRWIAQRLGLGDDAGGTMASGGTICTITALVTARHQRGLDGQQACLYASADCHSSLAKALRVMGVACCGPASGAHRCRRPSGPPPAGSGPRAGNDANPGGGGHRRHHHPRRCGPHRSHGRHLPPPWPLAPRGWGHWRRLWSQSAPSRAGGPHGPRRLPHHESAKMAGHRQDFGHGVAAPAPGIGGYLCHTPGLHGARPRGPTVEIVVSREPVRRRC